MKKAKDPETFLALVVVGVAVYAVERRGGGPVDAIESGVTGIVGLAGDLIAVIFGVS